MLQKAALLFLFSVPLLQADSIIVDNQTELQLYGATYTGRKKFIRQSNPQPLAAQTQTSFERPPFTFDLDSRLLIVSFKENDLKPSLTQDESLLLPSQDISTLRGSTFYIDLYKEKIELFNAVNWKFWQPIRRNVFSPLVASMAALKSKTFRSMFETQKSKRLIGKFRQSTTLSPEEREYLIRRKPRITSAQARLLGRATIGSEPLTIAVCCSGGGIRAALATSGFFAGLEKIGLLNAITYAVTLSGSTWALSGWIDKSQSASTYKDHVIKQSSKSLFGATFNGVSLSRQLFAKFVFGHPLSLVDVYGGALGGLFFDKPYQTVLSDQAEKIKDGSMLLPIYTAILTKQPYQVVEFNPFRVGCDYLGGDIEPWAFGQEFIKGNSTQRSPEEPMGFLLGIFGYAIGVNTTEAIGFIEHKIKPAFLGTVIKNTITKTDIGRQRLLPAQILNFTYGIPELPRGQQDTLTLIDAGILFNIPLQPLFEKEGRSIDAIIILDNSDYPTDDKIGEEMIKAISHLQNKGKPLPAIDIKQLGSKICSVFHDPNNVNVPTIIYMPLATSARSGRTSRIECLKTGACSTFTFEYEPAVARIVADTMQMNVVHSKNILINALKQKTQQKKSRNNR